MYVLLSVASLTKMKREKRAKQRKRKQYVIVLVTNLSIERSFY